jgi:hypothetical protein
MVLEATSKSLVLRPMGDERSDYHKALPKEIGASGEMSVKPLRNVAWGEE